MLGLFILEKRSLCEEPVAAFQYIKEACEKDGERLFTKACSDRTRCNAFKMKVGGFRLDIRKKFLKISVVRHWNMLAREVVDASLFAYVQDQVGKGSEQLELVKDTPGCKNNTLPIIEESVGITSQMFEKL